MSFPSANKLRYLNLASKSPRRAELLQQIGVQFQVVSVNVEEIHRKSESAMDYVTRLAKEKALAGYAVDNTMPVLGADTIVECLGAILEKPQDQEDAVNTLVSLSGKTQNVITAMAIAFENDVIEAQSETRIVFREVTHEEAEAYWSTGEPQDKAGSYAIQGLGAAFVKEMCGSYSGVVGLSIEKLVPMLKHVKIPIWQG